MKRFPTTYGRCVVFRRKLRSYAFQIGLWCWLRGTSSADFGSRITKASYMAVWRVFGSPLPRASVAEIRVVEPPKRR